MSDGERFPPADAQELARLFGVRAMSAGSALEVQITEWLRAKYRSVYTEGWHNGHLDGRIGAHEMPGDEYK